MPFQADNWGVSVRVMDRDNNFSTTEIYFQGALAFVDVESAATGAVVALAALTDGVVVGYSIGRSYRETTPAVPAETSDVERKGHFAFNLADGRLKAMNIPSFRNDKVIDFTNQINRADTQVAAFVLAVAAAGTDATGEDIIDLKTAEKRHRGSSRG